MRRASTLSAVLLLSALALTGCTAGVSDEGASAPQPGEVTELEGGAGVADSGGLGPDASGSDGSAATIDREVITTGYVTVTVDDPLDAADDAVRIIESNGGRVDGRSEYAPTQGSDGSATLTLRVPADRLTATLEELRELGKVQEVSLNATDVTMETQDLDARINALSASVDRLLALLTAATDTDTLIQLETAISERQADLESLTAQRRYYTDQISLSTVTLNLVSEYTGPVDTPDNFLSGLEAGWNAFLAFFAGLLVVFGVLLPWLLFAGLVTLVVILLVRRRRPAAVAPTEPAREPVAADPTPTDPTPTDPTRTDPRRGDPAPPQP